MAFCCCTNASGTRFIAMTGIIIAVLQILGSTSLAYHEAQRITTFNSTSGFSGVYSKFFEHDVNETDNTIEDDQFIGTDKLVLVERDLAYLRITFILLSGAAGVFLLVASAELDKGVDDRNYWRCNTYYWWSVCYLVYDVATFPIDIILFTKGVPINLSLSSTLISWIITIYCISIVSKFMKEIKDEEGVSSLRVTKKNPYTNNVA